MTRVLLMRGGRNSDRQVPAATLRTTYATILDSYWMLLSTSALGQGATQSDSHFLYFAILIH